MSILSAHTFVCSFVEKDPSVPTASFLQTYTVPHSHGSLLMAFNAGLAASSASSLPQGSPQSPSLSESRCPASQTHLPFEQCVF